MKQSHRRRNLLQLMWAGESGLAVIQWIGLGAVTLVAAVAIIAIFASGGGGAEVRQAVDSGTTARVDCLDSNCEHWNYQLAGAQPGAVRPPDGKGLSTAGQVAASGASDGASLKSDAASTWDRFWKGAGTLFGKTVQFGKNLLGKLGDFAGDVARFGKNLAGKLGDLAGKVSDGISGWWDQNGWRVLNILKGIGIGLLGGLAAAAIVALIVVFVLSAPVSVPLLLAAGAIGGIVGGGLYGAFLAKDAVFSALSAFKNGFLGGAAAASLAALGAAAGAAVAFKVALKAVISAAISNGIKYAFTGQPPTFESVWTDLTIAAVVGSAFKALELVRAGAKPGLLKVGRYHKAPIQRTIDILSARANLAKSGRLGVSGRVLYEGIKKGVSTVAKGLVTWQRPKGTDLGKAAARAALEMVPLPEGVDDVVSGPARDAAAAAIVYGGARVLKEAKSAQPNSGSVSGGGIRPSVVPTPAPTSSNTARPAITPGNTTGPAQPTPAPSNTAQPVITPGNTTGAVQSAPAPNNAVQPAITPNNTTNTSQPVVEPVPTPRSVPR